MYVQSDRSFQLWAYSVSHSQLLIRSPKSNLAPENVDIAFFGVKLMELPVGFIGLTVDDASSEQIDQVRRRLRDPSSLRRVYRLMSEGRTYLVAAADMRVSNNVLDYHETDLDFVTFLKPGQRIVDETQQP